MLIFFVGVSRLDVHQPLLTANQAVHLTFSVDVPYVAQISEALKASYMICSD